MAVLLALLMLVPGKRQTSPQPSQNELNDVINSIIITKKSRNLQIIM